MAFPPASQNDSNSGLFSLTQMQHLMRVEFSRSQRYGYPLACMGIQIDRLAQLRDLYGFESKEAIVEQVVDVLRAETRSSDYLGRTPDDKLLCIVPHTDVAGAEAMAQRILDSVRELSFESGGRSYRVTVSMGASSAEPGATLFFDAVTESARSALDEATQAGGDRFVGRPVGAPAG